MQLIERCVARAVANATSLKGASDEIAKGVTQYVGARYVPLFAEPLEWDKTKAYEPLTIVLYQGNSYTSRQYVPVGVEIDNDSFWANTGNYNAQVEQYRQEVKTFDGRITANANAIETEATNRAEAVSAEMQRAQSAERELQSNIDAEKTLAESAEQTLQSNIDAEKTRAESAEQTIAATLLKYGKIVENVGCPEYYSGSDSENIANAINEYDIVLLNNTYNLTEPIAIDGKTVILNGTVNGNICFDIDGVGGLLIINGAVNATSIGLRCGSLKNTDHTHVVGTGYIQSDDIGIYLRANPCYIQYLEVTNITVTGKKALYINGTDKVKHCNNNIFNSVYFKPADADSYGIYITGGDVESPFKGECTDNIFNDCSCETLVGNAIYLSNAPRTRVNNVRIEEVPQNKRITLVGNNKSSFISSSSRTNINQINFEGDKSYPLAELKMPIINEDGFNIFDGVMIGSIYYNNSSNRIIKPINFISNGHCYNGHTGSIPVTSEMSFAKQDSTHKVPCTNAIYFESADAKDILKLNECYGPYAINNLIVTKQYGNTGCKIIDANDNVVLDVDTIGTWFVTANISNYYGQAKWSSTKIA